MLCWLLIASTFRPLFNVDFFQSSKYFNLVSVVNLPRIFKKFWKCVFLHWTKSLCMIYFLFIARVHKPQAHKQQLKMKHQGIIKFRGVPVPAKGPFIYRRVLRGVAAWGSCTNLVTVGPTKRTGCLRTMKSGHVCIRWLKSISS